MSYMIEYLQVYGFHLRECTDTLTKKRLIKPRFWVFMMATLVLVFTCVYVSQGQLLDKQNVRIKELEAQRISKMSENALIERKIAFTKTDEYIERVAHDELGLLKEGEIRFVASDFAHD